MIRVDLVDAANPATFSADDHEVSFEAGGVTIKRFETRRESFPFWGEYRQCVETTFFPWHRVARVHV